MAREFNRGGVIGGLHGRVRKGTFEGRDVAIKRIGPKFVMENDDGEHSALLRLDHQNVVKLIRLENEGEFRYLIMELCDGTLRDFLDGKYHGPMPDELEALKQMAAGLQYIHSESHIHKNIKPSCILISTTASSGAILKISGFGFSSRSPAEGRIVEGELIYFAPELLGSKKARKVQLNMSQVSQKSDVFALGCTFFVFLTRGNHPFGQSPSNFFLIVQGQADLSELSEHFATSLIRQMIDPIPAQRPSALEICSKLDRAEEDALAQMTKGIPLLGTGRYGNVYRKMYRGRNVAVKRIELVRCVRDVKSREEQEIMRRLKLHPNVLKLIKDFDKNEYRYLILEMCDGTLEDFVLERKDFGIQSNELDWMHQMSRGVEHIHSNNLVHRDIKPQNVLISITSDIVLLKISDFGFCRPVTEGGSFSFASGVKGTFDYMAPEVLKHAEGNRDPITERATIASDVFSLGCVFFYFLRKMHPFGEGFLIVPNIQSGKAVYLATLHALQFKE